MFALMCRLYQRTVLVKSIDSNMFWLDIYAFVLGDLSNFVNVGTRYIVITSGNKPETDMQWIGRGGSVE